MRKNEITHTHAQNERDRERERERAMLTVYETRREKKKRLNENSVDYY